MAGHRQRLTSITTTRHPRNLTRHVEKWINSSIRVYYRELFCNKASSWMGPSPAPRRAPQRASTPTRCQPTAGRYFETSKQRRVGQSPTSETPLRSLNTAHALWTSVAGRSCFLCCEEPQTPPPLQPQFPQRLATSSPRTSHLAGPQVPCHPHSHLSPHSSSSRIKGLTRTHPPGEGARAHFSSSP